MPGVNDKKLLYPLIKFAKIKHNTPTYSDDEQTCLKINKNNGRKNYKIGIKEGRVITADSYAHEVGHLLNDKEDRWLTRKGRQSRDVFSNALTTASKIGEMEDKNINKKKGELNLARKETIKDLKNKNVLDTGTGVKESLKRMWKGNAIIGEERTASKKGLKLLKQLGATKEQIKTGKDKLDALRKTYKDNAKIYVLNPIQNLIQVPGKRRK